ncbi:A/G specific adenine glycosylase [Legionella rubrilucens]|uniref:Adenine DNA glycosylase n=1 Tax=Legionella rubrilucens TaxID=458 RepID=A0A0W0XW51_9GAMM|nr:A/G-specific adenine glycosylase [Legionella rubrilucens]KTD48923.1 A/G specific adenine glycosylase [Legionella rubrilucens]
MQNPLLKQFSLPLLAWYDEYGRKDLPWQHPRSAYRVWVSEIMLQQTQVQTVLPYFDRFMHHFPTVHDLAEAGEDWVMAHWSGLGYYSRARNLHRTAQLIASEYGGEFPQEITVLAQLPGIGPSTAAAIASQAFNRPTAILDGNVKRVLSRYFMVDGWPEKADVKNKLWQLAQDCMPLQRCADYTQAIMDLGATCCTSKNPGCERCPVQANCLAFHHRKVSDYPFKKQKKPLPVRHRQFLLLCRDNQEIYLEKNPPKGLWSSLWCLPSLDTESPVEPFIEEYYGFNIVKIEKLTSIKHTFSHFHLHMEAHLVHTGSSVNHSLKQPRGQWVHPIAATELALAKPIRDLIERYLEYLAVQAVLD